MFTFLPVIVGGEFICAFSGFRCQSSAYAFTLLLEEL